MRHWRILTTEDEVVIEEEGANILNYTISDAESLQELSNQVSNRNTFEGEKILQIENIDLSSRCSALLGSWNSIGALGTTRKWFNGT